MDFLALKTELSYRLGVFNISLTDDSTRLGTWINMAYHQIAGSHQWPWLMTTELVQTTTDITTGTVAATNGSTTITFSSGPAASVTGRYIKFTTDSENWYKITAHTAASTSATITPAFGGTTQAASDYIVRKLYYATSTPLSRIWDMKRFEPSGLNMSPVSATVADAFLPLYHTTGTPYHYIIGAPADDGSLQFSLLYPPDSVINLMVRGMKHVTDMSANTDEPIVPKGYHHVIVALAAYYGYTSLDDTRSANAFKEAQMGIETMKNVFTYNPGKSWLMKSPDTIGGGPAGVWTMPEQFGPQYPGY